METIPEEITESEEVTQNERETEEETKQGTFVPEETIGSAYRINAADNSLRSSFSGVNTDRLTNVWTLSINGSQYKVCFPVTDNLVEVDGVLVNIGSSNITGVVVGDTMDLSTYFRRTFTIMPLSGNTSQNNAYRYGAHAYLSTYSQNSTTTLSVVNDYGDASVVQRAKIGSTWSSVNVIIVGLLALHVLISFIGGLLKRG